MSAPRLASAQWPHAEVTRARHQVALGLRTAASTNDSRNGRSPRVPGVRAGSAAMHVPTRAPRCSARQQRPGIEQRHVHAPAQLRASSHAPHRRPIPGAPQCHSRGTASRYTAVANCAESPISDKHARACGHSAAISSSHGTTPPSRQRSKSARGKLQKKLMRRCGSSGRVPTGNRPIILRAP